MSTTDADSIPPAAAIRQIDPNVKAEIDLVAERMRLTLVEVEGEANAALLHNLAWLRERLLWHVHGQADLGRVLVATSANGEVIGHTLLRREFTEDKQGYGLFATTYVTPASRRYGVASQLLNAGEQWFLQHALTSAATWTSSTNSKLISLYKGFGYAIIESGNNEVTNTLMVKLARTLPAAPDAS